jgi:uncharacterized phage protein (TIGR02218 family)
MAVTDEMKEHLRGTLTVAVFLSITAKPENGGDVIRVTNCMRPKLVGGEFYMPVALRPSQLQTTNGLKPDNLEALTVLGGLFTEVTLLKRKWLGARVEYRVLNWKDFSMGYAERRTGFMGRTEVGRFTAKPELISLSAKLAEEVGLSFLAECDVVELGDARCGFDLSGNTADGYRATTGAHIASILNKQQFTIAFDDYIKPADHAVTVAPDNFYERGKATFTSGENDGEIVRLYANAGNAVTLWLPSFYNLAVNDTLQMVVGCNRKIAQCVARFANGRRNRSFFMLPGRSKLLKIPD